MLEDEKKEEIVKPKPKPFVMALYPRIIMSSGNPENLEIFAFANRNFYWVPADLMEAFMQIAKPKYGKYPKKQIEEEENEKIKVIKPYIKQIYGWSEREFNLNQHILLTDTQTLTELSKLVGMSKAECKTLGINYDTFKVVKPKVLGQTRLF